MERRSVVLFLLFQMAATDLENRPIFDQRMKYRSTADRILTYLAM